MIQPITTLDVVKDRVGEKDSYTYHDFVEANVPMSGGCQGCAASIGAFNAHPSKLGFLLCTDCVGDRGFESVAAFETWEQSLEE